MLSRLMTVREQVILLAFAGAVVTGAVVIYLQHEAPEPLGDSEEGVLALPVPVTPSHGEAAPSLQRPAAEIVLDTSPQRVNRTEAKLTELGVAVAGAVRVPGVYYLEQGSRVQDLIRLAGGLTQDADVSNINASALLLDATTLTIPEQPRRVQEENTFTLRRSTPVYNLPEYTRSGAMMLRHGPARPLAAAEASDVTGESHAPATPVPAASAAGGGESLINLNTATARELATLPGIGPELSRRIVSHRNHSPFRSVDDLRQVAGIGDKRLEAVRPLVAAP